MRVRVLPALSRTPYDGKPFYCGTCGAGLEAYYGCEDPVCQLETETEALGRFLAGKDAVEQARLEEKVNKEIEKALKEIERVRAHNNRRRVP